MKDGQCEVVVYKHPTRLFQGCITCGKIITSGSFLIGIHVCEQGCDYEYFLGTPDIIHCGEQKMILQSFETAEDAELEREKVLLHLSGKGTTEGLILMRMIIPQLN